MQPFHRESLGDGLCARLFTRLVSVLALLVHSVAPAVCVTVAMGLIRKMHSCVCSGEHAAQQQEQHGELTISSLSSILHYKCQQETFEWSSTTA